MASSDLVICAVCGAKNPPNKARCEACGAKIEVLSGADLSEEEMYARRHQQDTFEIKWVVASFAVYVVLQAIFLVGLPMAIDQYDPQGLPGLMISAAVWFVGGMIVGFVSPGKTFFEPAVGAFLAVIPTIAWLRHIADVSQVSMLSYVVFGVMGVMVTLFGAFLGEKVQMSTRGHAS